MVALPVALPASSITLAFILPCSEVYLITERTEDSPRLTTVFGSSHLPSASLVSKNSFLPLPSLKRITPPIKTSPLPFFICSCYCTKKFNNLCGGCRIRTCVGIAPSNFRNSCNCPLCESSKLFLRSIVHPPRVELGSKAPQASTLSIKLRVQLFVTCILQLCDQSIKPRGLLR